MRYMSTPRAAVAAPAAEDDDRGNAARTVVGVSPPRTLWASRPLTVRAGRLVAVRLRGEDLRVGVATAGGIRWVRPELVMTVDQATRWVRASGFVART